MNLTLSTTLCITWAGALLTLAVWLRFDQFPWEML